MDELIDLFVKSGFVVWSFPLYHAGIPAKMKAFLDRTLPISRPKSVKGMLVTAVPNDRKHVLISSAGYISSSAYTGTRVYKTVYKMFAYNFSERAIETIFFGGWQFYLENKPGCRDEYLSQVKCAGKEYSLFGSFLEGTKRYLSNNIYDEEEFWSDFMDYFNLK